MAKQLFNNPAGACAFHVPGTRREENIRVVLLLWQVLYDFEHSTARLSIVTPHDNGETE